jgi:hypothetical protein
MLGKKCHVDMGKSHVCFECLLFKVTEPNSIPYRTHSACAKRAAYPDPPPVIPPPESGVAEVTSLLGPAGMHVVH